VGNAVAFGRDKLGFLERCYARYGHAFTVRIFGLPAVFLIGPEANRLLLGEQAENFLWRPAFANLVPLLGEGLLVTDGALHDQQRRLVLPAFQRRRVEGYAPLMWDYAQRFFARWRPGEPLDVDAAMRRLTLQIAGRTLFGIEAADGFAAVGRLFEQTIAYSDTRRPFDLFKIDLPFTPWGRFVRARRRLDRFVYGIIRERLATAPAEAHDDVLTALIGARDADGTRLSARQVRDQIVMLLAAGHETTAHTLTWTLYLLARHPAALERVLAEQRAVLAGDAPTPNALGELRYLEMVFKEALRLYPPAWAGPRVAASAFIFDGHYIPAGTYVVYSQWLSHRLPEVFPEPEAFRPERFAPEQAASLPPYAYVPFGGGARLCLGMAFALQEAKIILSALLRAWRLALEPGQRVVPMPMVTLLPRHGMYMRPERP
jgi:cytochrome P450